MDGRPRTPGAGHALPPESRSARLFRRTRALAAPLAGSEPDQCAVPTGTAGGGFGFHVESVRVRSSDT